MDAVAAVFIVQMGPCRQSGRTYVADDIALSHPAARVGKARQVSVQRRDVATVLQDNHIPVATLATPPNDFSIAGRSYRRSGWSSVVDSSMRTNLVQARMASSRIEIRTDA